MAIGVIPSEARSPDGHALVEEVAVPFSSRRVTSFAITVEPAGGSPAPTTAPILSGAVATIR